MHSAARGSEMASSRPRNVTPSFDGRRPPHWAGREPLRGVASNTPWEFRICAAGPPRRSLSAHRRDITWLPRKLHEIGVSLNRQIWRFDVRNWSDVFLIRYDVADRLAQHSDLNDAHCDFKITMLLQLSPASSYHGGSLEFGAPSGKAPRAQGSFVAFPAWMPHRTAAVTYGRRYVAVCFGLGPSFR